MSNLSKNEKIAILRKEFLEMDLNYDEFLSKDELYTSLEKKVNKLKQLYY